MNKTTIEKTQNDLIKEIASLYDILKIDGKDFIEDNKVGALYEEQMRAIYRDFHNATFGNYMIQKDS